MYPEDVPVSVPADESTVRPNYYRITKEDPVTREGQELDMGGVCIPRIANAVVHEKLGHCEMPDYTLADGTLATLSKVDITTVYSI